MMSHMESVAADKGYTAEEAGTVIYSNFVPSILPVDVDDASYDPEEVNARCMVPVKALEEQPFSFVEGEAGREDLSMKLEVDLRYYTGCAIAKNKDEGLNHWRSTTHLEDIDDSLNDPAFRAVMGKAHLCLCMHWYDQFIKNEDGFDLVEAAKLANMSACLTDTISPIGPIVASRLYRMLEQFDEPAGNDDPISEKDKKWARERNAEFGFLWEFLGRRNEAMERMERVHEDKVRRAPNVYECARDGCGLRARSQMRLKKCAGPCPPELKPHYCSKDCQRKDWPVHKREKGRTTSASTAVALPAPPSHLEGFIPIGKKGKKDKALRMLVPSADGSGRYTEISSSTMSPESMKEFQASIIASRTSQMD